MSSRTLLEELKRELGDRKSRRKPRSRGRYWKIGLSAFLTGFTLGKLWQKLKHGVKRREG